MTRKSDETHVRRIRKYLDALYAACLAANKAGLSVTLTPRDPRDEDEAPRIDAWITRDWTA